jgi:hypothetical protein
MFGLGAEGQTRTGIATRARSGQLLHPGFARIWDARPSGFPGWNHAGAKAEQTRAPDTPGARDLGASAGSG